MNGVQIMKKITFENQVAIITGAGGGIGYALASELARRGARLLINDYGGNTYGGQATPQKIEEAAELLRQLGAEVVTDSTPVGTAAAAQIIVQKAVSAFGRVDMLLNNAGITLPGLITSHSEEEVEQHFRTNLLGPYLLTREVWPIMQNQQYGRILNTSSNAALGIGGNAAYGTSKAGLVGMTLDTALEGKPHGILVNAMMPTAFSRMIEQIPAPDFVNWFRKYMPAEKVAAAVSYFLSRESEVTGRVFAVGGGRVARVAFAEAPGWVDTEVTAEKIRDNFENIDDMSSLHVLSEQKEAMELFTDAFPFQGISLDQDAVIGAGSEKHHK
jgi:NAD(P)-dependent dehydrogenase (short-subunit alcohol dehydrogenase family)